MHHVMWGIPLETWRQYDTNLHQRTPSTAVLLELNMLDDQDANAVDRQELQTYLALQQEEAAIACGGSLPQEDHWLGKPAPHVRLVIPPGHSVVVPPTVVPRAAPSPTEVPSRDEPSQGPAGLVQLAAAAEAQSGVVWRLVSPLPATSPIKGTGSDPLPSNMPPTSCSSLVPRTLIAHPYCAENQRLLARVRALESQLVDSQPENSSLTTALRDTSHTLDARQREVEQLWSSSHEVLQHEAEYRSVLDQFSALDRALSGLPGQTVVQRFQALEEELCIVKRDRDVALGKLSTASRKSSELKTALMQQQGLVDETNALAIHQHRHLEELREEVHRTRDRATFVEQMIKEYPDEGFYEVVLPPLLQLEEDLQRANKYIQHIATFAHRLYRSDPATVLHHQSHYIGAIIEAVVAFLRHGLDSDDPDIVAHNFRLALDYMQTARGIYGDLYMRSVSSIQWFFNNAVDKDEGLHRLVLEHSHFENDGPFLTAAQHAGFTAPPDGLLEPPLHRWMWDDVVPTIPSLDELTSTWERLMLDYIHHIIDTPLSGPGEPAPMSVEPGVQSSDVVVDQLLVESGPPSSLQVPLFLPEQESLTSPSPPPPSPVLPPLFGSVAPLSIDLTGDDDELYEMEVRVPEAREVEIAAGEVMPKDELL
ncbi:hypothetical protein F5876DRAFT_83717 [Lentinula aff. lateritia]|uniref:Uncharacterized protein n=1 Tax=Lentinula aff. lateritia TaxID=2804960 RepID=A0ACC1THD8_9AGAR|nr:hypothetical protein F5876DRAFT_83717 [Lentinula aff. lateritia]